MSFDVVVAADLDWGIGKDNGLPWPRLRGDLAHFRRVTSDAADGARNAIVMGRKTWQSKEVGGKPLPRRLNIVVTRGELAVPEGVVVAGSLDAGLAAARTAAGPTVATVYVVGGAQLYTEALAHPQLRYVYLTRVEGHFGCDTTIPALDDRFIRDATWLGETIGNESDVSYRIERLIRASGLGLPASG